MTFEFFLFTSKAGNTACVFFQLKKIDKLNKEKFINEKIDKIKAQKDKKFNKEDKKVQIKNLFDNSPKGKKLNEIKFSSPIKGKIK